MHSEVWAAAVDCASFLKEFRSRSLITEDYHVLAQNVPRAAVLSVPNGMFLSETGSQTSISPSRIMLLDHQIASYWIRGY